MAVVTCQYISMDFFKFILPTVRRILYRKAVLLKIPLMCQMSRLDYT